MTSAAAAAGLPLAAAILGILAAWAGGFDRNAALPPGLAAYFYGFFLDRYPLFSAAILYGLARLIVAATAPGATGLLRRSAGLGLGAVLLLGLSLYPTFGGLVLRGAFSTGGVAFIKQQPMVLAYALGAAVGAVLFGMALGLGSLVAGAESDGRGFKGLAFAALTGFLSLWFAFAVLGLAHEAGFGAWPRNPLRSGDALLAAGLVLAAFLPHAASIAWHRSRVNVADERVTTV